MSCVQAVTIDHIHILCIELELACTQCAGNLFTCKCFHYIPQQEPPLKAIQMHRYCIYMIYAIPKANYIYMYSTPDNSVLTNKAMISWNSSTQRKSTGSVTPLHSHAIFILQRDHLFYHQITQFTGKFKVLYFPWLLSVGGGRGDFLTCCIICCTLIFKRQSAAYKSKLYLQASPFIVLFRLLHFPMLGAAFS